MQTSASNVAGAPRSAPAPAPDERASQLEHRLRSRIEAADADGILLSGGLDTCTIAALAVRAGLAPVAFTVCVRPDQPVDTAHRQTLSASLGVDPSEFPSPDARFAESCARHLGLEHEMLWVGLDELLDEAPATIAAIRSFDPMQVRNAVTIHHGLLAAKRRGVRRVLTGDGADEMYAGYSHMWAMPADRLAAYLRQMAAIMRFTTPDLCSAVGVSQASPFTEPALVQFALELPAEALVGEHDGRRMGKMIIRRVAEPLVPPEIVWRVKTPIEYGSGSTFLAPLLAHRITDEEFSAAKREYRRRDGVRLRNKEQLWYYRAFRDIFGRPSSLPRHRTGEDCPFCQSPIDPPGRDYCGVCGAWGFGSRAGVVQQERSVPK